MLSFAHLIGGFCHATRTQIFGWMDFGFHTNGEIFSTALYTSLDKVRVAPPSSKYNFIFVNPYLPNAHDENNFPRDAQELRTDVHFAIH